MSEPTQDMKFDNYRPKLSSQPKVKKSTRKLKWLLFLLMLIAAIGGFIAYEIKTSYFQSKWLHEYANKLTYQLYPFKTTEVIYPQYGPFDIRHGYTQLPQYIDKLISNGFVIKQQAGFSPLLMEYAQQGFFPPYNEKTQSGLIVKDCRNQTVFNGTYPKRVYQASNEIPQEVMNTLLFIENRQLWNPEPHYNPVIDWPRFAVAVTTKLADIVGIDMPNAGGSTLATQIEKFRHSEFGLTLSIQDKLLQIGSAMVRVYQPSENTLEARKRIAQDYLNTVPLSSAPGFGEVNGIGDGLWAWFKTDFERANALLTPPFKAEETQERGQVFRQIVALMIAQRRPSYYLLQGHDDLESLVDSHLRLLVSAALIDPQLMSAAMVQKLTFNHTRVASNASLNKGVKSIRVSAGQLLSSNLFDLDRLDLTINSTIKGDLQNEVSDYLQGLALPQNAQAAGLLGERLLTTQQLGNVTYSFTLLEKRANANVVRVQSDSSGQPFDINQGSKLELGSTAKLRVLATYLDIVAELQQRFASKTVADLYQVEIDAKDTITRWVVDYLINTRDKNLARMLDAALERRYSASPNERFFTGGGLHVFNNFQSKEDNRNPTLYEALQDSVNLPFVRVMQEIVNYSSSYNNEGSLAQLLKNDKDPRREEYLKAFAKREGGTFVKRFYRKYKSLSNDEKLKKFYQGIQNTESRLAATFRYLEPEKGAKELQDFLSSKIANKTYNNKQINQLYFKYGEDKFNLADQGYIARVHPLELWVLKYLLQQPDASLSATLADSQSTLVGVYSWLFRTRSQSARDQRIKVMLEVEAFLSIHQRWQRMGYPFDFLVPSLGSALGSSGDRPSALAELMGIIQNDGVKLPTRRINKFHFAQHTPYEVELAHPSIDDFEHSKAIQALKPDVAKALKRALTNVVEHGTAKRLKDALLTSSGQPIQIGGKTGTGDNRIATEIKDGRKVASTAMNRTATFVFYLGDNYFGTLTAFVPGAKADDFSFTSALPLQVLKGMLPILTPHLFSEQGGCMDINQMPH
ncbi:transglycosylase domain-containing protein [Shewanella gaetbuli]|uniref:peptidoglycan glycosyltransferase n=1 Tax=Shewanella gaetbuli TaxID=220752 RepID=A0A9X1ZJX9_9GAMM|nr:transglycosylase domain-containing protein [Shewanella gaetbuli]